MGLKKYQPSNGTEGEIFMDKFCNRCKREKFTHTLNDDDAKCPILTQTMVVSVQDEQYPTEWIYDEHDNPTCTAFSLHIWHDLDGNIKEPEEVTNDPNQLNLFNL